MRRALSAAAVALLSVAGCARGVLPRAPLAPRAVAAVAPAPPAPSAAPAPPPPAPEPATEAITAAPPGTEAPAEAAPAGVRRAFRAPAVPRDQTRVLVLLYHLVGTSQSAQSVEPAQLEDHLRWLADEGIEIVTTSELAAFLEGAIELPERAAVITIDDGHATTYTRAYPILKRFGVPFTLALNTAAIEERSRDAVTWSQVNEMVASGLCELASHSHAHGHMPRLTEITNRRELSLSRALIEARTGVRPEVFVFPFGEHTEPLRRLVQEAGYRAAFAVDGAAVHDGSPRWAIPRASVGKGTTVPALARLLPKG